MNNFTANPGSKAAKQMNCTCPVHDNNNGKGFLMQGKIVFYMNEKCPIHGRDDDIKVFQQKMLENMEDLEPEFQKVLDENFWELIGK